jgi:WhiB family redox-sensing transcriptional regulator
MREPRFFENPGCAEIGGDLWFPEKEDGAGTREQAIAKAICRQCPHQIECAEWGIKHENHGIWGGLVPRERLTIRSSRGIQLKEGNVA